MYLQNENGRARNLEHGEKKIQQNNIKKAITQDTYKKFDNTRIAGRRIWFTFLLRIKYLNCS